MYIIFLTGQTSCGAPYKQTPEKRNPTAMGKQHRRQLEKQVQFQLILPLRLLDKDLEGLILNERIVPQESSGQ